jgi:hypothetical protein
MATLLKKITISILVVLAILFGYKYFTGKSLADLPSEIAGFFSQQGPDKNTNPVYYKNPADEMQKDQ